MAHSSTPPPVWSYQGDNGPARWGQLSKSYQACQLGQLQSPIHIRAQKKEMSPALKLNYLSALPNIVNTGHTLQVEWDQGSEVEIGKARYELKKIQLHHPAEHEIQNQRFDFEFHLIHENKKGEVLVIGVVARTGAPNDLLSEILRNAPSEPGKNRKLKKTRLKVTSLIQKSSPFFRYPGSMTSPPCQENVQWLVFKDPITIGRDQLEAFKRFYPKNNRPIQALNGRRVVEFR